MMHKMINMMVVINTTNLSIIKLYNSLYLLTLTPKHDNFKNKTHNNF